MHPKWKEKYASLSQPRRDFRLEYAVVGPIQALPAFNTVLVGKSPPGDRPDSPDMAQPQATLQTPGGGQASVRSEVGTEWILLRSCRTCSCMSPAAACKKHITIDK